jgi:hypothetical protein
MNGNVHHVVENIDHDVVLARAHDLELGVNGRQHARQLEEVGNVGERFVPDSKDPTVVVVVVQPVFVPGTSWQF